MNKLISTISEALNTALHAVIAGLAASVPANLFTSWDADEAWLVGAATAGLVAAAHYVGKALQGIK